MLATLSACACVMVPLLTSPFNASLMCAVRSATPEAALPTAVSAAVAMPGTALVAQLVNALVASGGGDLDYAALGTVLFGMAGVK